MRKRLLMVFCMGCLFLFLSSAVRAEKLSVPVCGFIAEGHQAEQLQLHPNMGSYIYRKNATEDIFYTPVYLPHGSIVKWIRYHVVDNDAAEDMQAALIRVNKYTGSTHLIYSAWSTGDASASIQQFTDASPFNPAHALVNNDVCTYWIGIFFGGVPGMDQRAYGITIYYE